MSKAASGGARSAEDGRPVEIMFAGHRGFGASQVQSQRTDVPKVPENSLISIQEVIRSGAESVEFDLYLSSDGRLMVIHDDDLSINAHHIVQRDGEMRLPDGSGFHPKGALVAFPPARTFVSKLPMAHLKQAFDISKGMTPADCPSGAQHLYKSIPVLEEVLDLVAVENARRADAGLPRVKLNIELKGEGTGHFVQKAINDFNARKEAKDRIKPEEIYYMSFRDAELAAIAGLVPTKGDSNPRANLVLGIPTAVQYRRVGEDYDILDARLNDGELGRVVENIHGALQGLDGRDGKGLTAVDMSMWDVSDASIDYFCKRLKLPIHIAVVPFGKDDLQQEYVLPALGNINKIAAAQGVHLGSDQVMIVKTDNPVLLESMIKAPPVLDLSHSAVISSAVVRERGGKSAAMAAERGPADVALTLHQKPGALKKQAIERAKALKPGLKESVADEGKQAPVVAKGAAKSQSDHSI